MCHHSCILRSYVLPVYKENKNKNRRCVWQEVMIPAFSPKTVLF